MNLNHSSEPARGWGNHAFASSLPGTSGLLAAWLCLGPLLALSQPTNCKKVYDEAKASAERNYREQVASIEKTAQLNNMKVNKILDDARKDHDRALEQLRKMYDDCVARANESDRQNAKQIRTQADQIRENNEFRRFKAGPYDEQRRALQNANLESFTRSAKDLTKRAEDLDNQAREAQRRGDWATARALYDAASELSSQASSARELGSRAKMEQDNLRTEQDYLRIRQQNLQRQQRSAEDQARAREIDSLREQAKKLTDSERNALRGVNRGSFDAKKLSNMAREAEKARRTFRDEADQASMAGNWRTASSLNQLARTAYEREQFLDSIARDVAARNAAELGGVLPGEVERQVPGAARGTFESFTGFRTTVPGESFVQAAQDYVEEAEERVEPLLPLAKRGARLVESIGDDVDRLLRNPAADIPRRSSSGGGSAPNLGPPPKWLGPAPNPGNPPHWLASPRPVPGPALSSTWSSDKLLENFIPDLTRGSRFDSPAPPAAGSRFDPPAPAGSRFDPPVETGAKPRQDEPGLLDRLKNWLGQDEPTPAKALPKPAPEPKNQFNDRRGSRFD